MKICVWCVLILVGSVQMKILMDNFVYDPPAEAMATINVECYSIHIPNTNRYNVVFNYTISHQHDHLEWVIFQMCPHGKVFHFTTNMQFGPPKVLGVMNYEHTKTIWVQVLFFDHREHFTVTIPHVLLENSESPPYCMGKSRWVAKLRGQNYAHRSKADITAPVYC
jgi:hypothetical protein